MGFTVQGHLKLAQEIQTYCSACERLLCVIGNGRALTNDEALLIDYYCKELSSKVAPFPPKSSFNNSEQ